MKKNTIYLGKNSAQNQDLESKGALVNFDNEVYYKITNSNTIRHFFMSLVSSSNHWMFIASNGGVTAGRKDAENALFPYYTDDKITESANITGSKTIMHVHANNKTFLWEPFSDNNKGVYAIKRNLYKNSYGNKVVFEEVNEDLEIIFRYSWNTSNEYGFVKKSTIETIGKANVNVTILDGIQNIVPCGVSSALQAIRSNLVDAYKKCELEKDLGIGIYALSAIIVDKAEPSEALKANLVWSTGVTEPTYLISSRQLDAFRKREEVFEEVDVKAEKGAYFTIQDLLLTVSKPISWLLIADVNKDVNAYHQLANQIKNQQEISTLVQNSIHKGTKDLTALVAAADGLQTGGMELRSIRHYANTLFNIMRGGIFDSNYTIEKQDFIKYIAKANKNVFKNQQKILQGLPKEFSLQFLKQTLAITTDTDFKRLSIEYLPLKFSRRHGDPSRPWNKFSINTQSEIDGSKILDYEGNWRDVFQNWEALAHSYPDFMEGMIYKFLNATTFDGYNPYRVTKDGFDWETIEPDDPWSYIGYWGDHQIIYLLKFLEFIEKHNPGKLATVFTSATFVYANVPYKIKSYQDIVENPKDTIDFDVQLHNKIQSLREQLGADGALLRDANNHIYKVNMIEKLLATVLSKLSNFIPEAGIWMNTQRPEWNDANNALVGNGVSMVTLYYLQRFLDFFEVVVKNSNLKTVEISVELLAVFKTIHTLFSKNENLLNDKMPDKDRKEIVDALGAAGSTFRNSVYNNGFRNEKKMLSKQDLESFFSITKKYVKHTIKANKRSDNLYHAYNLMSIEQSNKMVISYLPEMLEGQVAILSAGFLSPKEALAVLDALKESALFREDQYSYILYPNKNLGRFVNKNNIPKSCVEKSTLLQQLIADGNTSIIVKDIIGGYHFNANFNNASILKNELKELPEKYKNVLEKEEALVLDIYEEIFRHKYFTGRSGTFFGYEGLGSIYWHMVSKLLLAVQENCMKAIQDNESEEVLGRLLEHYYEINEGIGVLKSPKLYGAFPTDPYSHTPENKGAQQPGMTGQVKEDFLSRLGELGVFVKKGEISFNLRLLRNEEFTKEAKVFNYIDCKGEYKELELPNKALAFTYCQVPIVYEIASVKKLQIFYNDGTIKATDLLNIDKENSDKIFKRTNEIARIHIAVIR